MLVTCYECGAKISEEADPCPHCGAPVAGKFSKEVKEDIVNKLNGYIGSPVSRYLCHHTVLDTKNKETFPILVSARLKKGSEGYWALAKLECPICGYTNEELLGGAVLEQIRVAWEKLNL